MAVRLIDGLRRARTVTLGEGVTMTLRAHGFADMKAAEARAHRLAQDRLADAGESVLQAVEAGESAAEYRDRIAGLAEEILLDALVEKLATGWDGVEDADGKPLPLTPDAWRAFRQLYPHLADRALLAIRYPQHLVDQEGNASAPSPSGR